ncbi:MAG: hypothetical protein RIM83_03935 [Allomuricauda sp.]|jgi:hypothetical protein|uniref:hypothetical protein n=1 Tax=Allomuricauda sp. CP2A TaxID=1848189 RepID=UPI000833DF30|nr:hypothetical protein [Muricauda sp. CP2A]
MNKYILVVAFMIGALSLNAQEVSVGDVFEIGTPDAPQYEHIDFPRANFIIKRGGIANYKRVEGNKVVVTSVKEKKDGTLKVRIKRIDGNRFFGSHWQVAANFREAVASGELVKA